MQSMTDPGMVIIGAGEAGTRAALTLRERGYDGPVTLIGAEPHPPYERPPLSKAAQTDAEPPQPTLLGGADSLAGSGIDYRPGSAVTGIDRISRTVALRDGTRLPYSRLLIATGASPRRLNLPGADTGCVLYLRTFGDAVALRARLGRGIRLVVIGGGFIGLEVAASALERGCRVTVVEAAPRVLGRVVPAEVAAQVAAHHRAAGITDPGRQAARRHRKRAPGPCRHPGRREPPGRGCDRRRHRRRSGHRPRRGCRAHHRQWHSRRPRSGDRRPGDLRGGGLLFLPAPGL